MPLAFPSAPTVGQQSTQNGRTYQWTGSAWELVVLVGTSAAITNAGLLTSGTLDDARLSANVVLTGDSRLTNARAPTAHKATHATGGTDAITPADIGAAASSHTHTLSQITDAGTSASRAVPASGNASSTQVVLGSDTRLTDSRAPTGHNHTLSQITDAGTAASRAAPASGDATSTQVVLGSDTRLTNTRAPTDNSVTTAKIANSNVTYAKIQNVTATDRVLGRSSPSAGVVEEITCTAAGRALIGGLDAAAQRTTLGALGTAGGTMTGALATIAGNALAPGLAISGDTNTGIAQTAGADTIGLVAGGMEVFRVNGSGNINAVIEGAGAGMYPGYVCRAWINFQGNANSNITGTYSQSGTTVTITTSVAHSLSVGRRVVLDFTSGTATDQGATVASVTSATVFTATLAGSATTSGNVTLVRNTIRSGGNVTSVADAGLGNFVVNMFVPAPHTNYAVLATCAHHRGATFVAPITIDALEQGYFQVFPASTNNQFDSDIVCVAVFY